MVNSGLLYAQCCPVLNNLLLLCWPCSFVFHSESSWGSSSVKLSVPYSSSIAWRDVPVKTSGVSSKSRTFSRFRSPSCKEIKFLIVHFSYFWQNLLQRDFAFKTCCLWLLSHYNHTRVALACFGGWYIWHFAISLKCSFWWIPTEPVEIFTESLWISNTIKFK